MSGSELSESFGLFHRKLPQQNTTLIKQPDNTELNQIKTTAILIDSRDRNTLLYPEPSKYSTKLLEEFRNVTSIELLSFDVPFSDYNITNANNVLHYTLNDIGIVSTVLLEPGQYIDSDNLTEGIGSMLPNELSVNKGKRNNKLTFKSDLPFTFLFKGDRRVIDQYQSDNHLKKNSIGRALGFVNKDYISKQDPVTKQYIIQSDFPVHLEAEKYIGLKINNAGVYRSNSNALNNCFAIISTNQIFNSECAFKTIKHFNPPTSSLEIINISFVDYNGNIYDFNNRDHVITLKISNLKKGRRLE
jgi:hypothetical protein